MLCGRTVAGAARDVFVDGTGGMVARAAYENGRVYTRALFALSVSIIKVRDYRDCCCRARKHVLVVISISTVLTRLIALDGGETTRGR